MKSKDNRLHIYKNTEDISRYVKDYDQNYNLILSNSDVLYIGYRKNLTQLYIEVINSNTTVNPVLKMSRWNGTSWVEMSIEDQTFGLKKSGYIYFNDDNETLKQTINSVEKCYYKIECVSNTTLYGIGVLFCSLQDLKKEEPNIERFFPLGYKTHVLSQKAATDYILDTLNMLTDGEYKCKCGSIPWVTFNELDLFYVSELNLVASYYTLYKIFDNLSDSDSQDQYSRRKEEYLAKYENRLRLFTGRRVTLDQNQDGKVDSVDESKSVRKIYIKW